LSVTELTAPISVLLPPVHKGKSRKQTWRNSSWRKWIHFSRSSR